MTRRAVDFVKCTRRGCETRGRHCHPVFHPVVKRPQVIISHGTDTLRTWEIRHAVYNNSRMFQLINEGWEPFSVTYSNGWEVWLRKRTEV